jgi:hypothetical protein
MSQVFQALNLNDYPQQLNNWNLELLRTQKQPFNVQENAPILFQKFDLE